MGADDTVILAEKPNQARAYAEALTGEPVNQRDRGPFATPYGLVVTAQGHLRRFEEPRDRGLTNWSDPCWPDLMIKPPMRARDGDAERQLRRITSDLARAKTVIVATDPDREGDAIAWTILALLRRPPPRVERMLCSEQNHEPIRKAFAALEDAVRTRPRASAALARARIDLLAGTNLTVAVCTSLRPAELRGTVWPVGRVKTPTLWLVVERERAIKAFRQVDHYVLVARFQSQAGEVVLVHRPDPYLTDRALAERLAAAAEGMPAELTVSRKTERIPPPLPFDKPSLLQEAARQLGWRPDVAANVLQELYDAGHVTYPRSACRHLSSADADTIAAVCSAIGRRAGLAMAAAKVSEAPVVRRGRVVDDAAVARASHTAIIPTKVPVGPAASPAQLALYDLIARQYLAAFAADGIDEVVKVSAVLDLGGQGRPFSGRDRRAVSPGWRDLANTADSDPGNADDRSDERIPRGLASCKARCSSAAAGARRTEPPQRYTHGSLIKDMLGAHRWVQDPVVAEALRTKHQPGIGTAATIESIPLELVAKGLVEEVPGRGKVATLRAPTHAVALVDALERAVPDFVRPDLTGRLEIALQEIEEQRDPAHAEAMADQLVQDYAKLVKAWFSAIKALPVLELDAAVARPGHPGPGAGRGAQGSAWRRPAATANSGGAKSDPAKRASAKRGVARGRGVRSDGKIPRGRS